MVLRMNLLTLFKVGAFSRNGVPTKHQYSIKGKCWKI
jgi:hypothetical protein